MKKQGYSNTKIARGMGRDPATIGRELRRNIGKRGYRYQQANCMAKLPLPAHAPYLHSL